MKNTNIQSPKAGDLTAIPTEKEKFDFQAENNQLDNSVVGEELSDAQKLINEILKKDRESFGYISQENIEKHRKTSENDDNNSARDKELSCEDVLNMSEEELDAYLATKLADAASSVERTTNLLKQLVAIPSNTGGLGSGS